MRIIIRGASVALASLLLAGTAMAQTVTLRVWDTFTEGGGDAAMQELVAAFEAKYPDIKVERDAQSVDHMRPVIQTALASGTGPDVFYYDTGPGFAGVLAKAGLLMPLDDAYASQGWDHIYPWTKDRTAFDGKVYGIGNELEYYGVYYNKDLFAQHGLQAPTTYEEFLDVAEKLKQAGVIPIAFGNQAGWPAFHTFSVYANNFAGAEKMEELLFNNGNWNDPAIVEAIRAAFVEPNEKGYLIPDVNAVHHRDARALFANGGAGMSITGSWATGAFNDLNPGFEVGWFWMPKPGGGALPPAGLGSGYFVSSKTANPEAALTFLDFLFDPANAKIWYEKASVIPPYDVDSSGFELNPIFKTVAAAASTQAEMGLNIDVLTPDNFNTAMKDGFQAVLLGQKTPEQQAADLQAAMEAARKNQ